jgi:hypothetical protein
MRMTRIGKGGFDCIAGIGAFPSIFGKAMDLDKEGSDADSLD